MLMDGPINRFLSNPPLLGVTSHVRCGYFPIRITLGMKLIVQQLPFRLWELLDQREDFFDGYV